MIELSEAQVKGFIEILARVIPKGAYRFDEVMVLAWHPFLKNFSVDELQWFIGYAVDNLDDFPSLKKIRGSIRDKRNGVLGVDPVTALLNGLKNRNSVSDPINQLSLKFGGWEVIGQWPQDQWEFKRKSIADAWEQIKKMYRIESVKPLGQVTKNQSDQVFVPRTPEQIEQIKLLFKKNRSETGMTQ